MKAVWSLNEIEALARKSARGAGYDWGMAEEASLAVRWLLARGLPGADALLMACRARSSSTQESCPLTQGCLVSDGVSPEAFTCQVFAPLLILPFAAWAAQRQKTNLGIGWSDVAFSVTPDGDLSVTGNDFLTEKAEVGLSRGPSEKMEPAEIRFRAEVSCETFVALSDFAGKTYAPATEASRESGAGAGLTDND